MQHIITAISVAANLMILPVAEKDKAPAVPQVKPFAETYTGIDAWGNMTGLSFYEVPSPTDPSRLCIVVAQRTGNTTPAMHCFDKPHP